VVEPPERLTKWSEGLERALWKRVDRPPLIARPATYAALLEAAGEPERWLTAGPLVPDDVVYTGEKVWRADAAHAPEVWLDAAIESIPDKMIVAVQGLGVVLAGSNPGIVDAMEENLLAHVLIRQLIARRGKPRELPRTEIEYLLSMESEKHRQAIAANDRR
jgi:hypothetical protein